MIPFLYQGQYYDHDIELAYNRFRYYNPETGTYISQDPIGLAGNNPTFYAYVHDSNSWVDPFGLNMFNPSSFNAPSANLGGTGNTYKIFQQNVDWDLPVNTRDGIKTNLELAEAGRSPFVVKDGKYSQINLHHSKQNAKGPLFELSAATHQKYYGTKALHPHLPNAHPTNPVNRSAFDIDREAYWKERASKERSKRLKINGCK
ncbi:RHS repeat-associated core domain-containing protein [Flavobacterium covae]|uniref:RHS repeat-associated core domain-containing protein n=1 Tax=Flavobacterium covae TaxID=2906076 RepID=UPI0035E43865